MVKRSGHISMEKSKARRIAKRYRDQLDASYRKEASGMILGKLRSLPDYSAVSGIFLFSSIGSEVETREWAMAFREDGKRTYYPRTGKDGEMEFFQVVSESELKSGAYGILEPTAGCPLGRPAIGDWVLTPGLLFDSRGYRLGYGGGFYDRYMERCPGAVYIGVAFEGQRTREAMETDFYDRRLRRLVTDERVYDFEEDGQ